MTIPYVQVTDMTLEFVDKRFACALLIQTIKGSAQSVMNWNDYKKLFFPALDWSFFLF